MAYCVVLFPLDNKPDQFVVTYCVVLFPSGIKPDQSVIASCVVSFPSGNKPDQFVVAYCVVSFPSGNLTTETPLRCLLPPRPGWQATWGLPWLPARPNWTHHCCNVTSRSCRKWPY